MPAESSGTQVNQYQCDVCGWIYVVANQDHVDLPDQPETYECPECQATKDHFQPFAGAEDDLHDEESGETGGELAAAVDEAGYARVSTKTHDPSVSTLKEEFDDGSLNTRPGFQRYLVWGPAVKSRLIESVLLDLPLPRVYLAENEDETVDVVDGQQRLMTLFEFLNGKFKLNGLNVLKDLNGKHFSDLDAPLKRRIRRFAISTVTLLKESDDSVRFDLFERLNRGATALNDQELRNCIYRGEYNDFIYDLATLETWRKLLNLKGPHRRMADAELVLRYMAFRDKTYLNFPEGSLKDFLNQQMLEGTLKKRKERDKASADFKRAIDLTYTVFGPRAFKKFTVGDAEHPTGRWESKRVLALADVQLWGFTRFPKNEVIAKSDDIREAAVQLIIDPAFDDLVTSNTSTKSRVEGRFVRWKGMLDSVLDADPEPRLFPFSLKKELFEADPTCAACQQQIQVIDDAQVDHRKPFAQGGKTERENAQLMHRYCNLAKGQNLT